MNARCFKNRTHAAPGNNTGTICRRAQNNLPSIMLTEHFMRNGITFEADLNHIGPGPLSTLTDRLWNFIGLTVAYSNAALAITGNDQCGEAETAPTLDHFGTTVDVDHFFDEFGCLL